MQKFLFINTKGFSIEQAIMAMHEHLNKIHADPEAAGLVFHTMAFVNTFETPKASPIASPNGNPQPVIVYNCCVTLVERDPSHNDRVEQLLNKISHQLAEMISFDFDPHGDPVSKSPATDPGPTDQEKLDLKRAADFICQHTNLDPARRAKPHRNPGKYFQFCKDCGAEVWQDITDADMHNENVKKMFVVPDVKKSEFEKVTGQKPLPPETYPIQDE
jgi:hypothetical protein